MKKILILLITFTFATELEVDGTLKVTGGIDAQGQPISNVGNPINPSDAIPMSAVSGVVTNAMSLAGMNPPERIYRYSCCEMLNAVVPINKIWFIKSTQLGSSTFSLFINDIAYNANANSSSSSRTIEAIAMGGEAISLSTNSEQYRVGALIIYEYSITSSGTDQGLDYVEP